MGGIASVAEDKDRILKAFVNKEFNGPGIYAFNVFIRGLPTIVSVDEQVLSSGSQNPTFAKLGKDYSMWGALLEKAWAKVNGNYETIIAGFGSEAFSFLTNVPSRYL